MYRLSCQGYGGHSTSTKTALPLFHLLFGTLTGWFSARAIKRKLQTIKGYLANRLTKNCAGENPVEVTDSLWNQLRWQLLFWADQPETEPFWDPTDTPSLLLIRWTSRTYTDSHRYFIMANKFALNSISIYLLLWHTVAVCMLTQRSL